MAKSFINFEFDDIQRDNDDNLTFVIKNLDTDETIQFIETYKSIGRVNNYTLTTNPNGIPLINPTLGEKYALDFNKFINIDYGGLNLFAVYTISNIVTITALTENWSFTQVYGLNGVTVDLETSTYVPSTYEIVETIISESDVDKCNQFKLSIETTELTESISVDGFQITNNNNINPFSIELGRDKPFNIRVWHPTSPRLLIEDSKGIPSFNIDNVNITINNSLIGATVIVDAGLDLDILGLQYSLDNINWQDSNIFTGQGNGEGTAYVKDIYGCKKSTQYEVTGLGTRDPFLFLSKANSINFIKIEDINDYETFKNNDNSFDSLNSINYCLPNLFKEKDQTRIQFKSNFEKIDAILRDEFGNNTNINLEKKTSNLNRFEKMDCIIYKYGIGELGIYFNSGMTYSELGAEKGTYILNGNLPDMAVLGNYVTITNIGTFEIKNILFDTYIQKKIIVIDYSFENVPSSEIIESRYDLLPFEVYEFIIDWNLYDDGLYDIYIENSNSQVTDLGEIISSSMYLLHSYNIHISNEHYDTVALAYWNENNRDIFYKYGIKHFKRMSCNYIQAGILDESELNIGDLTVSLNSSSVYETDTFFFIDLTDEEMRTLSIALSCEHVFINGIGYLKNGSLGVEPIENTNLHRLTAEMIKTNINYNTNTQGQEGVDYDYLPFNIPAFINADGVFIKA